MEDVELTTALNMYEKFVREASPHFHSEVVKKRGEQISFARKRIMLTKYGQKLQFSFVSIFHKSSFLS